MIRGAFQAIRLAATCRLVAVAVLLFTGCERRDSLVTPSWSAPLAVRVARAERSTLPRTQPVAGIVRPLERAVVAAKVTGSVAEARFILGQQVSKDEVLVTLFAPELVARVEQLKANLEQAKREAGREARLVAEGSSTAEAARTAEDRRRMAAAALEEAVAAENYTRIRAPFSGVVTRKPINSGDFATVGTPLFEIEATHHLRAEIEVPDGLPVVPINTEVHITTDERTESGRVVEASSSADAITRTRSVRVELGPGTQARSGQFVRVLWPAGESSACLVPASAIGLFGQIERVYVVNDGHAQLRLVRTGRREGARIEILSGLDGGEIIILSPPASLSDGQPVRLEP